MIAWLISLSYADPNTQTPSQNKTAACLCTQESDRADKHSFSGASDAVVMNLLPGSRDRATLKTPFFQTRGFQLEESLSEMIIGDTTGSLCRDRQVTE